MKKLLKIFAAAASLSVLMASCNEMLNEEPVTAISEAKAFASEQSLEAVITGCYRALCGNAMITGTMNEFVHDASGLVHFGQQASRFTDVKSRGALKLAIFSQNSYNYSQYSGFYSLVAKCNDVLEHLPDSPVEESFKTEIEGEARFLRAVAYYYIVRCWGDAPIYKTVANSVNETNKPRSPFWELYKIIIDDFNLAFSQMRDYEKMSSISGKSSGRVCNYAAKAMLSEVYLTIATMLATEDGDNFWDDEDIAAKYGEEGISSVSEAFNKVCGIASSQDAFQKAYELADDVIKNSSFALAPTYAELFRWTLGSAENSYPVNHDWELAERIFVIPNTEECHASNFTATRTIPNYFIETSHTDPATTNSNAGRCRPTRYLFQHWCEDYPGQKGTAKTDKLIYVTCADPRLDATLIHTTYNVHTSSDPAYRYPHYSKTCCVASLYSEAYYRKYVDPRYNANSGYADFYVMRMAEIYLIKAEAAANLSTAKGDKYWDEAFKNIEIIHKRARTKVEGDDGTGYSQPKWEANRFDTSLDPLQALKDAIFWERIYELTIEGHEYFDTHRYGAKWLSRMIARPCEEFLQLPYQKYSSSKLREVDRAKSYVSLLYGDKDFKYPSESELRKSLLFAFPYQEMIYNTAIDFSDQNKYCWE